MVTTLFLTLQQGCENFKQSIMVNLLATWYAKDLVSGVSFMEYDFHTTRAQLLQFL